jgi:hypothetical protein
MERCRSHGPILSLGDRIPERLQYVRIQGAPSNPVLLASLRLDTEEGKPLNQSEQYCAAWMT